MLSQTPRCQIHSFSKSHIQSALPHTKQRTVPAVPSDNRHGFTMDVTCPLDLLRGSPSTPSSQTPVRWQPSSPNPWHSPSAQTPRYALPPNSCRKDTGESADRPPWRRTPDRRTFRPAAGRSTPGDPPGSVRLFVKLNRRKCSQSDNYRIIFLTSSTNNARIILKYDAAMACGGYHIILIM